ncbi:hypothetical protein PputUW4_02565 [Pseudomonas sp. UW4]|nr:hypothetical protein PputUW4_02565 [Pseudomonas sp. UW4]
MDSRPRAGPADGQPDSDERIAVATKALGKTIDCGWTPVGASLLAMVSRAPRLSGKQALSLTTIASKLAPTVDLLDTAPIV